MLGIAAVPHIVGQPIVDVSIDSEKTIFIFGNGVVMEIEGKWSYTAGPQNVPRD